MNAGAPTRDVFHAISDPTRRKLIRLLADADELPLNRLAAHFPIGRTAVAKHLAVLKEAGLVTERKVGRETRNRLNPTPLREIRDWLSFYERFWTTNLQKLDYLLREESE
ncbi:metalloregulator ArsR/SmtB family transcription factor [Paenibacillus sp.]|uniref:ArsR/SmtB family transcription factor n=1 Tax=Paenibacillus sp. TaxID=58172 RepID=UPI002D32AC83|nr:metalloregulator ArsR/SmtB family transcription factor [Paenibacillus sp.]HZG58091.1 metalloregulator ArsR/SmtB family transcription factor [Paenibacillus sp.]